MNRDEILALEPGPELNRRVAEEGMGHVVADDETFGPMEGFVFNGDTVWGPVEPYSEDMEAVEQVIERLLELGLGDVACVVDLDDGSSRPEAICKNALLNVQGARRGADDPSERILRRAFGSQDDGSIDDGSSAGGRTTAG